MPTRSTPVPRARRVTTALRRHRRPVAAVAAVVAVLAAVHAAAPRPPATTGVLVAADDVAAGAVLRAADLRTGALPVGDVPAGALDSADQATGRRAVLPLRRGEVVTDVRLLGPGLLGALGPDVVATPVHLADADTDGIVRVGDHVDVLAAGESGTAWVVAADVPVLVAPVSGSGGGLVPSSSADGSVVVVAVPSAASTALARAAATARLSLDVRGD